MSRKLKNFLILIVLISIVFVSLFPILFLYGNSFMESSELQKHYHPLFEMNTYQTVRAIYLIPEFFSSEQYKILFFKQPTYVYGVINSMILVLPSLIGCFLIAPSAGYSLAIFDIPGKKIIIFFYILFSLLPSQTMLVPNYFVLSKIHLIRSRWAIWLPAIFTPLPVYLIYRFFQKTPNEMLESARIEGCSELRIFFSNSFTTDFGRTIITIIVGDNRFMELSRTTTVIFKRNQINAFDSINLLFSEFFP